MIRLFEHFAQFSLGYFDKACLSELDFRIQYKKTPVKKTPAVMEAVGNNRYLETIVCGIPDGLSFEDLYDIALFYRNFSLPDSETPLERELLSRLKDLFGDDIETLKTRLAFVQGGEILQKVEDPLKRKIKILNKLEELFTIEWRSGEEARDAIQEIWDIVIKIRVWGTLNKEILFCLEKRLLHRMSLAASSFRERWLRMYLGVRSACMREVWMTAYTVDEIRELDGIFRG